MRREDGLIKVLDFGLAKLLNHHPQTVNSESKTQEQINTSPGVILGTVDYMSPEQIRGKPTDERTDIWSLSVVLYEMCVGRHPFAGETTNDTIAAILKTETPAIDKDTPDICRAPATYNRPFPKLPRARY